MKRQLSAHAWLLGSLLSSPTFATAVTQSSPESPPIATDRPGFLFAPTVVPKGRLQIETGLPTLTLVRDSGNEVRTWNLPVALRYGMSEKFELRASLPAWTDVRDDTGASTVNAEGFGDSEIGAKWALPELSGGPLALQASLRLPTGETGFTTDEVGGSAFLLHGRDLGDCYWLQTMLGATYVPVSGDDDPTAGAIAALVSHPIADRWSAYVEGTALPGIRNAAGQGYLGGAVIFNPRPCMQLDLSADFGLDEDSADVIAALGVSWRF